MHAHKHRLAIGYISLDEGYMLKTVALLAEGDEAEMSVGSRHVDFHALLHR